MAFKAETYETRINEQRKRDDAEDARYFADHPERRERAIERSIEPACIGRSFDRKRRWR